MVFFAKIEYSKVTPLLDIIKEAAEIAAKGTSEGAKAVAEATKSMQITADTLKDILPRLSKITEFQAAMAESLKADSAVIKEIGDSAPDVLKNIAIKHPSPELLKNIGKSNPKLLEKIGAEMSGKDLFEIGKGMPKSMLKDLFKDSDSIAKLAEFAKDSPFKGAEEFLEEAKAARTGKVLKVFKAGAKFCKKSKVACTTIIGGAGLGTYLKLRYDHLKEDERQCIGVCLPSNWDLYENSQDKTIEYRSLPIKDDKGKAIDDFSKDNVCHSPEKDCNKFCEKACHVDTGALNLLGIKSFVEDTFKELMDLFNDIPEWIKITLYVGAGLLILLLILKIVSLFKK